jgi:ribonuclease-3
VPRTKRQPCEQVDYDARIAVAEAATGHHFADRTLVLTALTHPSSIEDRDPSAYYERLEFLGDSVLGFVVSEEVFRRFPDLDEGGMTRIKVSVVAGSVLSRLSAELGLADAIIVGESERGTGGRGLSSALENVYEALVAALYLDAGMEVARDWVLATLGPLLSEDAAASPESPKSLLQELTQARGDSPVYRVVGHEGPPHQRTFECEVAVGGTVLGRGSGRTKKEAEAKAAEAAIAKLIRGAKPRARRTS